MSQLHYDLVSYEWLKLEILVPDADHVKEIYEKGELKDRLYWSRIWPSSLALASWLDLHPEAVTGRSVVEIGAGLGLPSFIAARFAMSVLITDHIEDAIEWMNKNISRSGYDHVTAARFDWKDKDLPAADIVLMSDVGYKEDDLDDVHDMTRSFLRSGAEILLTVPSRLISRKFITPIEEFVVGKELIRSMDTDILLLNLKITDSPLQAQRMNS